MTAADPATTHHRMELTLRGLLLGVMVTIVFMGAPTPTWA